MAKKRYYNIVQLPLLSIILLVLIYSCSTKKNTFTRRAYHNLTSHFNAYWNGKESLKVGVKELASKHKDDYNKVLSVYQYGTKEDATSVFPRMDRAIKKAAIVIHKHSIFIRKKEHIKWIDDAYMLMGKAHFYKQEYRQAIRTFDFIIKRYKHNPIIYEAMLWIARSKNVMGKYDEAQSLLDEIQNKINKKKAPKSYEKELSIVYADFYVCQENYPPAIEHLQQAISLNHKKKIKNRLRYILAQIYQNNGYLQQASELYKKVIKKNPHYEMAFNAKINLAKCYDATSGDSKLIKKKLNKMLRDEKNKEYLDQIYYALAEVTFKENDLVNTKKYLRKSVSKSYSNDYQKTTSALRLADIYFAQPDYLNSKAYYDTAILALPLKYPNYKEIESKIKTLSELVDNILLVEREDSLQRLGRMSPKERNAIIDKIIKKIVKEEQRKRQEEIDRQQELNFLQRANRETEMQKKNQGGNWYFYNPSQLSFGFTEFKKKWGKRKLEDNWRLSNKQSISFDFGDDEEGNDSIAGDSVIVEKVNLKDRKTYMKDIPITGDQIKISNDKIAKALYNLGYIYHEKLYDEDKSTESFEELILRFPENEYLLDAYYQLYVMYSEMEDILMTDKYKILLVSKFPDSDYTRLILDPNYIQQLLERQNEATNFYKTTFLVYKNKNYNEVIIKCDTALSKYSDKELAPKFGYLRALSIGKTQNNDSLEFELNKLLAKYPESEIKPYAVEILEYLRALKAPVKTEGEAGTLKEEDVEELPGIYSFDLKSKHLYALIIESKAVKMSVLKIKISDFNKRYFELEKLKITNVIFNKKRQVVSVTGFENSKKVLEYYNTIKENKYIFASLKKTSYSQFIISTSNYATFYKNKNVEEYLNFFERKYLE